MSLLVIRLDRQDYFFLTVVESDAKLLLNLILNVWSCILNFRYFISWARGWLSWLTWFRLRSCMISELWNWALHWAPHSVGCHLEMLSLLLLLSPTPPPPRFGVGFVFQINIIFKKIFHQHLTGKIVKGLFMGNLYYSRN